MTEPTGLKPDNKSKALTRVETSVCGLVLNNLEDMKTVAQLILQSGLAPDSFKTSEQIFVGLQTGAEIGLKPMQALNSIVVIKGKPTLWGDAPLGLVKRSGLLEYCNEYFELAGVKITEKDLQYADLIGYPDGVMAVCETQRKDEPEPVLRYFSVADAKLARLWKKAGPWSTHPKRMLKYKARAFNLRDNFPDVLFGMHMTEEMYGEEPLPAPESDVKPRDERRSLAVPSTAVDTTRAPVEKLRPVPEFNTKSGTYQDSRETLTQESIDRIAAAADGETVAVDAKEAKPESEPAVDEDKKTEPDTAEPSTEESIAADDLAALYVEVNAAFVALNGQDFIAFAAYVLCLDESEISPSKLTIEQFRQVKAYIETSGVSIE